MFIDNSFDNNQDLIVDDDCSIDSSLLKHSARNEIENIDITNVTNHDSRKAALFSTTSRNTPYPHPVPKVAQKNRALILQNTSAFTVQKTHAPTVQNTLAPTSRNILYPLSVPKVAQDTRAPISQNTYTSTLQTKIRARTSSENKYMPTSKNCKCNSPLVYNFLNVSIIIF